MTKAIKDNTWLMVGTLFKSHPWHGIPIGDKAPHVVSSYIEVVPTDTIKYEVDKVTGHLMVDRPQKYSNVCPALYGFIPRTHCAEKVAELSQKSLGIADIVGDDDPLDICVLTENHITRGDLLLNAKPIGGFRMIDGEEADDKIVAVLVGDATYGELNDISQVPSNVIDRLKHYFLTYKQAPGQTEVECEIPQVYNREQAHEVILASVVDYDTRFGGLEQLVAEALN
jgi:inorganic pyrophosphatase